MVFWMELMRADEMAILKAGVLDFATALNLDENSDIEMVVAKVAWMASLQVVSRDGQWGGNWASHMVVVLVVSTDIAMDLL